MVSACLLKTNHTVVEKLRRDNQVSRSIDFSKMVMLGANVNGDRNGTTSRGRTGDL